MSFASFSLNTRKMGMLRFKFIFYTKGIWRSLLIIFFTFFLIFLLIQSIFSANVALRLASLFLLCLCFLVLFVKKLQNHIPKINIVGFIYFIIYYNIFGGGNLPPTRKLYNSIADCRNDFCHTVWIDGYKKSKLTIFDNNYLELVIKNNKYKYKMYPSGPSDFVLDDIVTKKDHEIFVTYLDDNKIVMSVDGTRYDFRRSHYRR